ncbi:hypothetical protein STSP2_01252 [Anaerohalosphaera lusitana]|uniref:Ig-like domain-containing protein n=2 Tax=Anaerohalosphaera lusitana TaxID=1936003 RepID=A0A1U9NJW5_9BACT|nr:hypothetical protein STSP2_01252 [Anaerohalosphaera lusitana]
MKKLLLTLVLLVALVGMAQAELIFSDDFESYSEGATPDWYNPKGDVTVAIDDGSVFESENQYVHINDPGTQTTVLREHLWYHVGTDYPSNTFATLSFDINEPDDNGGASFYVKLTDGTGSNWLNPSSASVSFLNGSISANGQTASYSLDMPHHIDIVVNMTGASGSYSGTTLQSYRYDVWVDGQLVFANVDFDGAATQILGINFATASTGSQLMNLDNVEFRDEIFVGEDPRAASNPDPASLQEDVPLTKALSWEAGIDPDTGNYVDVSEYHVYIASILDINELADPNLLVTYPANIISDVVAETGSNGGSWTPPAGLLARDNIYAWRVDEKLTDGTILTGANWGFSTVLSIPDLNAALPEDAVVGVGEDAELTVEATNPFTGDSSGLSYQWMYSADGVTYSPVGTNSPVMAITDAQVADQGYYYCDVTIDSNSETVSSKIALLVVKQALAHWTMDQDDFVNGQYVDIVGTYSTEPNSAPTFVTGAGPDEPALGAAVINPDSFAAIGTWNPLESTGQMTISAWLKWDGTIGEYGNDILSKGDGWGADIMMWAFKVRGVSGGNAGVWFYSQPDYGIRVSGLLPEQVWTHICLAFDSGQARLYADGELVATRNNFALGTDTESSLKLGGGAAFPGAMDEVMIHNYAMSADDVAALYYETSQEALCLYPPSIDLNDDCRVDLTDFAVLAQNWLECGMVPTCLP